MGAERARANTGAAHVVLQGVRCLPASPIQVRVLGPHLHLFGPVFEPRAPPDASPQKARPRCRRPLSHRARVQTTLAIELPGNDAARYRHLTTRDTNRLTATQAQTVIAAAILRHLHAVIDVFLTS
jgi:hypothetical protein